MTKREVSPALAREFGPQGVHVALAIIDGGIDTPWGKDRVANGGVEDGKIKPEAVRLGPFSFFYYSSSLAWPAEMG